MHAVLAGSLLLLVVLYYLGDDGQASFFPSYLMTLACLPLLALPGAHYAVLRDSRVLLALVLVAWLGASTLWSGSFDWRYPAYAALLATFIIGFLFASERFPRLLDWLVTITIFSAAISASVSIYLHYFSGYNPLDEKDRLYALGRNYQPTISSLSYSIPLIMTCVRTALRKQALQKLVWGIVAVPLVWAIFLTGTRGAWVGLFASAATAIIFLTHMSVKRRAAVVGLLIAGGLGVIALLYALGFDEFILRRSLSFRPEIWAAAIERITAGNWLIGNGINVSSAVSWKHLTFNHSHSIYLSTLFYGGIVGLFLLLTLLLTSGLPLLSQARNEQHTIALTTLAFAVVTLALDGNRLVEKVDHLWIVLWFPLLFAWRARQFTAARVG